MSHPASEHSTEAATPLPVRCLRWLHLLWHLLRGLLVTGLRFSQLSKAQRHHAMRRWSLQLLRLLSVRLEVRGEPAELPPRCLLVMNHVSWLDVFLINAVHPAMFVAKSEVQAWPLIGRLVSQTGTLYIDRRRKSATRRTVEGMVQALRSGELVAVFPEGTTTHGHGVDKFHTSLFETALQAEACVLPVALRYRTRSGAFCDAPAYAGETSLLQSIWAIVSTRRIVAQLCFLSPLMPATGDDRRTLALASENAIRHELGLPERGSDGRLHAPAD